MDQFNFADISDKRSIPFSASGTGTIATHGYAIVGIGTQFLTEMPAGSYLVNLTDWECNKVVRVDSDTVAFLEVPLTSEISAGTTPKIIHRAKANAVEISIKIAATDPAGKIKNAAFSGVITLPKGGRDRSAGRDLVKPFVVDATNTTMMVEVLY